MYKELIWNGALLSLGIFLILLMTMEISGTSIVPGWRSYPAGLIDKLKLGLLLGIFFIASRYILLGILNISHPDFRLSVLLLSYLLPILLILLAWHYYMDRVMGSFHGTIMPIEDLKKEVKLLQQAGLFKKHQVDSAEATEIAIGRALVQSHGIIYAEAFVNPANGNIDHERCIELDTDKACNVRNLIETETAGGIKTYVRLLQRLERISEEKFEAQEVVEDWDSNGNLLLTFKKASNLHKIALRQDRPWENVEQIIRYLNNQLRDKDYQFYWTEGELRIVIGLSQAEEQKLSELTELKFSK